MNKARSACFIIAIVTAFGLVGSFIGALVVNETLQDKLLALSVALILVGGGACRAYFRIDGKLFPI